jgi:hypothetical protein
MLKKFKDIVSEVAEPLSQGEKNFKALHAKADNRDLVPGVTDQDFLFKGGPRREDPKTASYENFRDDDESIEAYDKGLQVKPSAVEKDIDEATLSAKAARAGKDIGKPGKNFANIAASAAERYGSKEAGQRVAGAILKKMRAEEVELVDEAKTATGTMWTKLPGDKEHKVSVSVMSNGRKHVMTGSHSHVAKRLKSEHGLNMMDVKFKKASDMKEDLEQVDEVSKKAAIDAYRHRQSRATDFYSEPNDQKKADKTLNRIKNKFGSKTAKHAERGADIDDNGRKGHNWSQDYLDAKQGVYKNFSRPNSKKGTKERLGYMKMNKGRFTKEEIEQLDELSPTTLASYKQKAASSDTSKMNPNKAFTRTQKGPGLAGAKIAAGKDDEESKYALNRYKMSGGSVKVPAKEEVEHIEELTKKTLQSYASKAQRQVDYTDTRGFGTKGGGVPVYYKGKKKELGKDPVQVYKNRKAGAEKAWTKSHMAKEEIEHIDERSLSSAEMKKREEVVKAIKRENPGMDKSKAYAIATATAKKVAEDQQYLGPESKIKDNKHHNTSDYVSKNVGLAKQRNNVVNAMIKHDCAKHVAHEDWGVGSCIPGQHTIIETSLGEGYVSHYDVMFDHGIEHDVPVQDLQVLVSEMHGHSDEKMKMRSRMKEDVDFDYEGEMAKAELRAICDKADALANMMSDEMQLEAWLQSKITKAKYMIDSVYDYLMYSEKSPTATDTPSYDQSTAMSSNYDTFLNRMGEEVEHVEEATDKKSFASLAPPKDKITYADKIVGAKLQAAKDKVRKKPTQASDSSDNMKDMKEDIDMSVLSNEEKAKLEEIMKAE